MEPQYIFADLLQSQSAHMCAKCFFSEALNFPKCRPILSFLSVQSEFSLNNVDNLIF